MTYYRHFSTNQTDLEEKILDSIETNNLEKVKQFLSGGVNVNSLLRSRRNIWDTNCFSVLAIASFSGASSIVEFLLERKVNVNQRDSLKMRTALHWAVASGHFDVVKILIEAGAQVNALDRDSVSPLILAANLGNLDIVRILIQHGADLNQTDRMRSSALHYACMRFHAHIAKELIMNGCNVNTSTPFSFSSPLKYLVKNKQYETAKCLIESGCDLHGEKWITDGTFDIQTQSDQEFIDWVRDYMKRPASLVSICRQKVRRSLGNQMLADRVKRLNIPVYLKNYLMMKF